MDLLRGREATEKTRGVPRAIQLCKDGGGDSSAQRKKKQRPSFVEFVCALPLLDICFYQFYLSEYSPGLFLLKVSSSSNHLL